MKTKIYAAYGSNMHLEQMKKRCPKAEVIGKGELFCNNSCPNNIENTRLVDEAS